MGRARHCRQGDLSISTVSAIIAAHFLWGKPSMLRTIILSLGAILFANAAAPDNPLLKGIRGEDDRQL